MNCAHSLVKKCIDRKGVKNLVIGVLVFFNLKKSSVIEHKTNTLLIQ